jgi:FlaA1/EpsC-like NDP-sugar epimerase
MLFSQINRLKILPRWIIISIDIVLIALSAAIAYALRFNFIVEELYRVNFLLGVGVYTVSGIIAIFATKIFQGIIRYTSLQDSIRVFGASTLAALLALVGEVVYFQAIPEFILPISVLLISYAISSIFLVSYRIVVKYIFSYYSNNYRKRKNVILFGAGSLGQITHQILEHDKDSEYRIIGYLDDNPSKIGKKINGARIYSSKKDTQDLIKEYLVHEVIICVQNISLSRKNEVVNSFLKEGIKVRTVPPVNQWVQGSFSSKQIKDLRVEDLLGRPPILLADKNIEREIEGATILITGAAGSIGSEIARQVIGYKPEQVVMIDQSETALFYLKDELSPLMQSSNLQFILADIRNESRMKEILEKFRPRIIFHAAAYKHVPLIEQFPVEAIQCNVRGTMVLAELANQLGVDKFVMISTDKAVNPTNVMGASKRIAEIYVQSLNSYNKLNKNGEGTKFITTRFGNVLGSNGSVIPIFKKQIEAGGPVTVTHPDITRYFMTIPEACQLVLEAGAMGQGGEIFMFDMGKPVKIVELAQLMIRLYGYKDGQIQIIFTGLRPGEKIEEELLTNAETSIPTHHPKITIAKVSEYDYLAVRSSVDTLCGYRHEQEFDLVRAMKVLVPEFYSNASRFELLDQERRPSISHEESHN